MRAVRVAQFGDPSVLEVAEVPRVSPEKNEVLIKVAAAGINPGRFYHLSFLEFRQKFTVYCTISVWNRKSVDTYIRSGAYAPERLPKLPFTPGGDVSGTVVEVGQDVQGLQEGDRVYTGELEFFVFIILLWTKIFLTYNSPFNFIWWICGVLNSAGQFYLQTPS